ncbi:hypothetical protein QTP86_015585, partial [Hemibagrus guttatus]
CIISSKDSENLEQSLCVRVKAGKPYWMPVIFGQKKKKWTVSKWKTVLWSDESKFEVLFGKLGRHVIRTKEDKDNPSCYQRSVQKPASLMVWGCMSACGMGSLHIWKGTINAERYIQVLEQHMLPSRCRLFQGRPFIFQHDNARPHTASITTSWLRRRRIRTGTLSSMCCTLFPKSPGIDTRFPETHRIVKELMEQNSVSIEEVISELGNGIAALESVPIAIFCVLHCLEPREGLPEHYGGLERTR